MLQCPICDKTDCDCQKDGNVHVQFIVKESLRKKFRIKCLQKDIKPSEWLRQQVEKMVEDSN
jgi:hypothetical protein